ncbi:MAG: sugar ABC transporter ATP-binding protein [Chloroflexi bacterium]|nr:sugar ABC transporter ATP-binding protein [Chloroflexota bacterium]
MAPGPVVLALCDIHKSFGVVHALSGVDLDVRAGEVHALVGENGAGKSTLIAIAAGVHQPDAGEVVVRGTAIRFRGPADAEANGISVVYQELSLIGDLDVAQNVYLHREPRRGRVFLDGGALYAQCRDLLRRVEVDIDPRARVSSLSVAQRQLVEIAKALSRDAAVVFMDEPTASLTSVEQEYLFGVIARLRAAGTAVVYVSHRLDEIFRVADVVTVLKDGQLVRTMPAAATNHNEMVGLMVGRDLADDLYPARPVAPARSGVARLSIRGASSPGHISDIDLDVWPGEIVGLAGLIGSGRTSLLRAIFGLDPDARREALVDGVAVAASPGAAIAAGIGLVSEDRAAEGLALDLSNLSNLVSTTLPTRWGFYRRRAGRAIAARAASQTGLAARVIDTRSGALSGGNQQKVVVGKWLATDPRVLPCDEPTRGIDVSAKADIYALLRSLADAGLGILLSSSELPEILGMADRIVVLREGRLVAELPGGCSEEDVMQAAAMGVSVAAASV